MTHPETKAATVLGHRRRRLVPEINAQPAKQGDDRMSRIAETLPNHKPKSTRNRRHVGPWFRGYAADIDNADLQLLPVEIKWRWYELCCIASLNEGLLPSNAQLAFRLRCSESHIDYVIGELIGAGLIEQDIVGDRSLKMTGWNERQYVADRSAVRMRKHREKKSSQRSDVTCDGKSDGNAVFSSPSSTPVTVGRQVVRPRKEISDSTVRGVGSRESLSRGGIAGGERNGHGRTTHTMSTSPPVAPVRQGGLSRPRHRGSHIDMLDTDEVSS